MTDDIKQRRRDLNLRIAFELEWATHSNGEPGHDLDAFRAGFLAAVHALQQVI